MATSLAVGKQACMPPIKLIATDLDGTLLGDDGDLSLYQEFSERLRTFEQHFGTVWVVCTGRSLHSFERVTEPMQTVGLTPRYVIVRHAYIYRLARRGYWPHLYWNAAIWFQVWTSGYYLQSELTAWRRLVYDMTDGVTTLYHQRKRLCLRFRNEEDAATAATLLERKASVFKHLRVFHYMLEVDVRTVPFTKGMALGELSGRLGIKPSEILAIGNGHNDISMLDGSAAACTGCPANAESDVVEAVHRSGGHIASSRGLTGVLEVLDAYLNGTVASELPAWWESNRLQKNPKSAGRRLNHPGRHQKPKSPGVALRLGVLAVYTVLVVFASFDLLPFAGIILKPFTLVARLVERVMTFFAL